MQNFFTRQELTELLISILTISFIFYYAGFGSFMLCLTIVVFSFLFHELAHKYAAKILGYIAVYKMYTLGIVAGLVLVFFGIVFVAPGSVEILPYSYGRWGFRVVSLNIEQIGAIALSGISINLGFAVLFKLLSFNWPFFEVFYKINALIAFFNLLPAPPLDGSKIISWSAGVWIFLFIISLLMIADIFVF